MAIKILSLLLLISFSGFSKTVITNCGDVRKSLRRISKLKLDEIKALSSCFEKFKHNKIGIKFHSKLIKIHFRNTGKQIINTIAQERLEIPDVVNYKKPLLRFHIKRLTSFYLSLYEESKEYQEVNNKRHKKIQWFIDTLVELEEDEEYIQDISDRITEKHDDLKQYDFKTNYYVSLNFISWQNFHNAKFNSQNIEIQATNKSQAITLAKRWRNIHHEFNLELSYILGSSNLSPANDNIGPSQGGVGLQGVLLNFSYHTLKLTDEASFGIEIPFLLQRSLFNDSLNISEEQDGLIGNKEMRVYTGLVFGVHWDIKNFTLLTKIGKLLNTKSSFLQFGFGYNF